MLTGQQPFQGEYLLVISGGIQASDFELEALPAVGSHRSAACSHVSLFSKSTAHLLLLVALCRVRYSDPHRTQQVGRVPVPD